MYMLVFITLVVALIGTYSQMLAVQTARLSAMQTTIASAMLAWHSTAVAQARYTGLKAATAAGCSLTNTGALLVRCTNTGNHVITVDGANSLPIVLPAVVPPVCGASLPPCWTNLPTGYKTTPYTFHTFYFLANGQKYILTFVPPPSVTAANPAPGFLTLPGIGGTQIGATMSDLVLQLKNLNVSSVTYGTIGPVGVVNDLITSPISNGGGLASNDYPLPAFLNAAAYVGSIGIISTP